MHTQVRVRYLDLNRLHLAGVMRCLCVCHKMPDMARFCYPRHYLSSYREVYMNVCILAQLGNNL